MTSSGNVCASSHSITCGAISASANSRTDLRSCICSGVYSNSTWPALNDLFRSGVPVQGALLPVRINRHAARDGDAIAQVERAVRFFAIAHGIDEVDHVRFRIGARHAQHFVAIGPVL